MTKIDIFSGFLGAGKTTLIKKLIKEAYAGEKLVLIENEFGEIGVDSGFLQDAGINITEMNSGCICCSLVGDFSNALKKVAAEYAPDRIVIEPSGVGKLSDVIKAVSDAELQNAELNAFCTVVDAAKCKMYMKNFGEFFSDQVSHAGCIVLSHVDSVSEEKLAQCVNMLKEVNSTATFVTASWEKLDGKTILAAMERRDSLQAELARLEEEFTHEEDGACGCGHHHHEHEHHHDHEHGEDCDCGCHHHEHEHEHEHGCCEHNHEHHHGHHHEHGEDCDCGCHHGHEHHHGHGHHHADEIFTSWGVETSHKFDKTELTAALESLNNNETYGMILRAKGIVQGKDGWLHFDYVPGEADVRDGSPSVTGRLCVIGCKINEAALKELFKA